MDSSAPGYPGFRDYTPRFLRVYDRVVIGFMAPRLWRTTAGPSVAQYRDHLGRRHLDVGPGTGYAIAASEPPEDVDLTLVDPNPAVLVHCATTLEEWTPTTVVANVLQPLPVTGPFDSVGLSHVLHCLPGPLTAKARAIEHVAAVLTDDGVLFGGTVLGTSADHTAAGRAFLWLANRQGSFDNLDDDIDGLHHILTTSFEQVDVTAPEGTIAYFVASRPRRSTSPTVGPDERPAVTSSGSSDQSGRQ